MQIEAGKYYKTRDGRKVGPMEANWADDQVWPFVQKTQHPRAYWRNDGECCLGSILEMSPGLDLIEEWTEPTATPAQAGPVRMVRQIVPGEYGRVGVSPYAGTSVTHVGVRLELMSDGYAAMNADELRSAAMVFSQLAEALDDQP